MNAITELASLTIIALLIFSPMPARVFNYDNAISNYEVATYGSSMTNWHQTDTHSAVGSGSSVSQRISSYGSVVYHEPTTDRKIALRTSEWLCGSNRAGLLNLIEQIHASEVQIYFSADDWLSANWDWKMEEIDGHISYFRNAGKSVWILLAIHSLNELKGIAYNIQSYIDRYKGKITGIFFTFHDEVITEGHTVRDIQDWLVAKEQQLASNGLRCMYYHGDAASPSYSGPPENVDPVYLTELGLILQAWLQNDASWKPGTFDLKKFWIDYVILAGSDYGGPAGQTYEEIMNWYNNVVIGKYNLKANPGAEAIVWEIMNQEDMPGTNQVNAMIKIGNDWLSP